MENIGFQQSSSDASPKYNQSSYSSSSSSSNCYQISTNSTSNTAENSNDFYRLPVEGATAIAAAAIAAVNCNVNQTKGNYNTGAFLRYMRPTALKPENICSWIDPDTKKMCNRVFYRMDEIGKTFIWQNYLFPKKI